jgi:hypothetical protein
MSLSVNSVTPQSVNDTIELTWYEDSYTTMVLPDGTFSFAQGTTVYYNWESGDFPQFFSRLHLYNLFSGTADQSDVGDYTFVISATTDSSTYEYVTIHLTVVNTNDAPTLLYGGISDQAIEAGSAFSFTDTPLYFRDQDGDTLTYSATLSDGSDLPDWLSFDTATGAFSGTPARADVATVSVKVTATDPSNATRSDIFDITVSAPPNTAPTGSLKGYLPQAKEDKVYSAPIVELLKGFTDADGDTLSVENFVARQDGKRLDVSVGGSNIKITLNENSASIIKYSYTVSDGNGGELAVQQWLTVVGVDDPTVLRKLPSNQTLIAGDDFSYTLPDRMFTDVDGDDTIELTAYRMDGETALKLPKWLHFDPYGGDGRGVFSGTAPVNAAGSFEVRVSGNETPAYLTFFVNNPAFHVEERLKFVEDYEEANTAVARLSLGGFAPGENVTVSVEGVELYMGILKSSVASKGDMKNMFKVEKTVVDGDTFYDLVTTKKTDDILEDAGKKFTVTLEATGKSGATDEIDLTFKIKHGSAAAQGEHAFYAIEAVDPVHHGHDWTL